MYSTRTVRRRAPIPADVIEEPEVPREVPPAIYVIYEDAEHTQIFIDEIARRGLPYKKWLITGGFLDLNEKPPPGIFWCRFSPSASSRRHGHAIPYARAMLTWLDVHGATVINGLSVFDLEMSKGIQTMHALRAGLKVPRTYLVSGNSQQFIHGSKLGFSGHEPFYIKPDTGGSGMGVQRVANCSALVDAVAKERVASLTSGRSTAVMQSCAGWTGEMHDDGVRRCFRAEFVGGMFLYLLHIVAMPGAFSLCPCDDGKITGAQFSIVEDPTTVVSKWEAFVDGCMRVMDGCGSSIAAFEFSMDVSGEPVVFDVNFNNNYSELAEGAFGTELGVDVVSGVSATVDYLEELFERNEI